MVFREAFCFGIFRITSDHFKKLGGDQVFFQKIDAEVKYLVQRLGCNYCSYILNEFRMSAVILFDQLHRSNGLFEVARNPSDPVVGLSQPIKRKVKMYLEFGTLFEQPADAFIYPFGEQPVGWKIDHPRVVVLIKQFDDIHQIVPQKRFSARHPEFIESG